MTSVLNIYDPRSGEWSQAIDSQDDPQEALAGLYATKHAAVDGDDEGDGRPAYEDPLPVHVHVLAADGVTLIGTVNDHLAPHDAQCDAVGHVISEDHPAREQLLAAREEQAAADRAAAEADVTPDAYPDPLPAPEDGIDHATNDAMTVEGDPTRLDADTIGEPGPDGTIVLDQS